MLPILPEAPIISSFFPSKPDNSSFATLSASVAVDTPDFDISVSVFIFFASVTASLNRVFR